MTILVKVLFCVEKRLAPYLHLYKNTGDSAARPTDLVDIY